MTNDLDKLINKYPEPNRQVQKDNIAAVVDDELARLGWAPNPRLSLLGDLGRENNWDAKTIFGGHKDPKNKAFNRGIISWQGDRRQKLDTYLKSQGVYGQRNDAELRAMVRFLDDEMRSNPEWSGIHAQMRDPNVSTYDASESLRKYIKYVPNGPYNSYDSNFRVKNNAEWANRARQAGLGTADTFDKLAAKYPEPSTAFDSMLDKYPEPTGKVSPSPTNPVQPANVPSVVPETLKTLKAQLLSTRDSNSPKAATLITDPSQMRLLSPDLLQGFEQISTPNGLLFVNPVKAKALGVTDYSSDLAKLIGKVEDVGNNTATGTALKTTDANGNELSSSIVSPQSANAQAAFDRAAFPQAANQQIKSAQDIVNERKAEAARQAAIRIPQGYANIDLQPQPDLPSHLFLPNAEPEEKLSPSQAELKQQYEGYLRTNDLSDSAENRATFNEALKLANQASGQGDQKAVRVTPGQTRAVNEKGIAGELEFPRIIGEPNQTGDSTLATFKPTTAANMEDAARQALLVAGRTYDITPDKIDAWIQKTKAKGQQIFEGKDDYQPGDKIHVRRSTLEEIDPSVAGRIRMQEAQGRANSNTGLDLTVGRNWAKEDAEWLNSNTGKALTAINPLFSFLSDDQKKAIEDVNEQAGRKVIAPLIGGVLGSGGRIWRNLAGIARPINEDLYKYMQGVAESSESFERHAGDGGVVSMLAKVAGGAPGDLSKLYLLSKLPGGVITAMSADSGLQSSGRGDNPSEIARQTAKGAVLGGVFAGAPIVGKLGEYSVAGTFKGATAGAIARETATLGTIGLGSAEVEKLFGATDEQQLHTAVINSLFHLGSLGYGLKGRVIRARDSKGNETTVGVDPEGNIRLLKGQEAKADVEMYVDVSKGADGVYRTPGDTAPVREREVRLGEDRMLRAPRERGNPLEQPGPSETPTPLRTSETEAMRIDNPDPAAIQAASVDTRVRKVADALKGKDFQTVEEIAKATRINRTNVEDAVVTLARAGQVELLPDNRVRLVDESATEKQNSLIERAKNYGKTPQTPVSQPSASSAQGKNVPAGNSSASSQNVEPVRTAVQPTEAPKFSEEQIAEAAQSSGLSTRSVSPEQQRRDAGQFTQDGVTYQRQPEIKDAPAGRTGTVKFADSESPEFTYKLVDAESIQPAHINGVPNLQHFIPEAQPKVRTDKASLRAADRIADNINFGELAESPNAYAGSPIINSRGEVIQGNNRSAGIKLHYAKGLTKYKEDLASNAERFGFSSKQVMDMKSPVLVRSIDIDDAKAIELGNYDAKDTESGGTHRIEANKLAKRVPHDEKAKLLADVFRNADEEVTLNQLIRDNDTLIAQYLDRYLTDTQKQSMFADKQLSPAAVKDLEETFQHFLFAGGNNNLPGLFAELPSVTQKALTASLPKIFGVPENSSLVSEIQNAIGAANTFAESGIDTFENWYKQPDMYLSGMAPQDVFTPVELSLAKTFIEAKKASDIKGALTDYAKLVNDFEGDLFNEPRPGKSKADAVKEVFNVEHRERTVPEPVVSERHEEEKPQSDDGGILPRPDEETRDQAAEPAAEQRTEEPTRTEPELTRQESLTQTPPQELTPLMTARVRYALERKMPPGDIAQRYNLTPEQIESVKPLEPVGANGQTSYKLRQNFLPSKTPTDAEIAEKAAMINDLAGYLNLPDARVSRDTGAADMMTAFDLIRLTIAKSYGHDRGSQMSREDWDSFLDGAGTQLEYNTISGIVDALEHQLEWYKKAIPFVNDSNLARKLEEIDNKVGLANVTRWMDLPLADRKELIALGKNYGLKDHAIQKLFSDTFLDFAQEEPAQRTDRRRGQESTPTREAKAVERRSSESEELKSKEDTSISPWKTPEGRAEMAQARRKAIIEEFGLDTETDADIIAALENAGDILFNQTDLFGNSYELPVTQGSLFNMAEVKAAAEQAKTANLESLVGKQTSDYLSQLAKSPDKRVSKAALAIADRATYATNNAAKKVIEDAADGLDLFARAKQTDTPLDDMFRQGWIDTEVEVSERAKLFANAIANNEIGRLLNSELSNSNQALFAKINIPKDHFKTVVDQYFAGELPRNSNQVVSNSPEILQRLTESNSVYVVINESVIHKATTAKHNIEARTLKKLPAALEAPVAVFDAADKTSRNLVFLTDLKDAAGDPVLAILKPRVQYVERQGKDTYDRYEVDVITSVYGKEQRKSIDVWAKKDLLRYVNKEKTRRWLAELGTDLPSFEQATRRANSNVLTESDFVKKSNGPAFDIAEDRAIRRDYRQVAKLPETELLTRSQFSVDPKTGLVKMNLEGLVVMGRMYSAIGFGNTGFRGAYISKPQAKMLTDFIDFLEKMPKLSSSQRRNFGRINKVLKEAANTKYGDIAKAFIDPRFPVSSNTTAQEELGHMADARTEIDLGDGVNDAGPFQGIEAYEDAQVSLIGRYPWKSIHKEILGKIQRDDAAKELDITEEQVKELRKIRVRQLFEQGLTAQHYLDRYGSISKANEQRAKAYAKFIKPTGTRTNESDAGGNERSRLRNGGEARTGRDRRDIRSDRTEESGPDIGRLRSTSLRTADRGPVESLISPTERSYIERNAKKNTELAKAVKDEVLFSRTDTKIKVRDIILDVLSAPKSLKSSVDLSAAGRQGWITSVKHPVIAARAFRKQISSLASPTAYERFKRDLNLHPAIELAEQSNLFLATLAEESSITEREENFMSRLFADDPYFKRKGIEAVRRFLTLHVRASERAFKTFLDDLRINVFTLLAKQVHAYNVRKGRPDELDQYKGIAAFVNYSTGRGDLGQFNQAATYLNASFFSARFWASRLQVLNPTFYATLPPGARIAVFKELAGFVGAMAIIGLLLKAAGADVEWDDPEDPNMLKIGFGKYKYSLDANLMKHLRYVWRMASATNDKDATGKMSYLTERYIRSSLAPVPGAVWSSLEGKNFVGEPTDWKSEAGQLVQPISVSNFAEAIQYDGTAGAVKMTPEIFGIATTRFKDAEEIGKLIEKEKAKFDKATSEAEKKEISRKIGVWRNLQKKAAKYAN